MSITRIIRSRKEASRRKRRRAQSHLYTSARWWTDLLRRNSLSPEYPEGLKLVPIDHEELKASGITGEKLTVFEAELVELFKAKSGGSGQFHVAARGRGSEVLREAAIKAGFSLEGETLIPPDLEMQVSRTSVYVWGNMQSVREVPLLQNP